MTDVTTYLSADLHPQGDERDFHQEECDGEWIMKLLAKIVAPHLGAPWYTINDLGDRVVFIIGKRTNPMQAG